MKRDVENLIFNLMNIGAQGGYQDPFAWMVDDKPKKKRRRSGASEYPRGKHSMMRQQESMDDGGYQQWDGSWQSVYFQDNPEFEQFYNQYGDDSLTMHDVGGPIEDYWFELWQDWQHANEEGP